MEDVGGEFSGRFDGRVSYPEIDAGSETGSSSRHVVVESSREVIVEDKIHVAVGEDLKESKSTIVWALKNRRGAKICILHVHIPDKTIPMPMGGRFPISSLSEEELKAHRDKERQDMDNALDQYLRICTDDGIQAEKLHIEMDTVESGLVELISQHKIERLVMGAAADNRYSRNKMELKSQKAKYVRQHAPDFCHIFFVCNGRLIYTREGTKPPDSRSRLTQSASLSTASVRSFEDFGESATFSHSHSSVFSRSPEGSRDSTASQNSGIAGHYPSPSAPSVKLLARSLRHDEKQPCSPSPVLLETSVNNTLYDQLDVAVADAEIAKREAFEESLRRQKSEKDAIEAFRKVSAVESAYNDELRRRREVEEELEITKHQRDMALEELKIATSRSEKSDIIRRELEDKVRSTLELLQSLRQL